MADLFAVDNSVVMSWCFKDESSPYADSVLERLTESEMVTYSGRNTT